MSLLQLVAGLVIGCVATNAVHSFWIVQARKRIDILEAAVKQTATDTRLHARLLKALNKRTENRR